MWMDHMLKHSQIADELGKFRNYRHNQNVLQMHSARRLYSSSSFRSSTGKTDFQEGTVPLIDGQRSDFAAILMSKGNFLAYLYCFIFSSANEMTQMSRAAAPSRLHFINFMGFLFA